MGANRHIFMAGGFHRRSRVMSSLRPPPVQVLFLTFWLVADSGVVVHCLQVNERCSHREVNPSWEVVFSGLSAKQIRPSRKLPTQSVLLAHHLNAISTRISLVRFEYSGTPEQNNSTGAYEGGSLVSGDRSAIFCQDPGRTHA